jgi:hypothetical protein
LSRVVPKYSLIVIKGASLVAANKRNMKVEIATEFS